MPLTVPSSCRKVYAYVEKCQLLTASVRDRVADESPMAWCGTGSGHLEQARVELIDKVNRSLTREDKEFLIAFKKGDPDWDHLSVSHIRDLPAVRWKLHNLDQMNVDDRTEMVENLESFFNE